MKSFRISQKERVSELRTRVKDTINDPLPEPIGGSAKVVHDIVLYLYQMIIYYMGIHDTPIEKKTGECIIRLFFYHVEQFDFGIRETIDKTTPIWISQFNYQYLFNFLSQVEKHGSPRNRYKNSLRDEGFIKIMKPFVRIREKNW